MAACRMPNCIPTSPAGPRESREPSESTDYHVQDLCHYLAHTVIDFVLSSSSRRIQLWPDHPRQRARRTS